MTPRRSAALLTLLAGLAGTASAQQAVIPALTVFDSSGDLIGPVVSFASPNIPMVRIIDSDVDVPVFLEVRDVDKLQAPNAFTYFSDPGCTGTAYHRPSFAVASEGMAALLGYSYSVAKPGGGNQMLYRSDVTAGSSSISYASVFQTDACNESGATLDLRVAASVLDLDSNFPPPYGAD